jgi:hypothetical protein
MFEISIRYHNKKKEVTVKHKKYINSRGVE